MNAKQLAATQRAAANLFDALAAFPDLVDAYLEASGIAQSTFGGRAVANRNFVQQMRVGRDFRMSTVLSICAYIARQKRATDLID
jgi:hypothetical protein